MPVIPTTGSASVENPSSKYPASAIVPNTVGPRISTLRNRQCTTDARVHSGGLDEDTTPRKLDLDGTLQGLDSENHGRV